MKTEAITDYMAKIDRDSFEEFKKKNTMFNGRISFKLWVDYLSDPDRFDKFLETVSDSERERNQDNFIQYKIKGLNDDRWQMFLRNCRENDMYGVDMINILVKRFNNKGYCIKTSIKI